jgi:hypothetical protein
VTAPDGARRARIELSLGWCAERGAVVWWDDVSFTPVETRANSVTRANRVARVVTVYHRPQNTGSPAASVAQFCRVVREQARATGPTWCVCPKASR